MTPSARLSAAIEVFAEINERRRPAPDVLKDWGHSHRFAGSGDRAAIAGLVYDTLRRKSSSAWLMGEASPLAADSLAGAPAHVEGDYPEWLDPHLQRVFGEERAAEGAALSSRAPLDLRVNTIKGTREETAAALAELDPVPTRWSPVGLRVALGADAKAPAIHA